MRSNSAREFLIAGSAQRRSGFDRYYPEFDTPADNDGIAHHLDGEASGQFVTRARVGDLSFEGAASERRRSVPTAPYETMFNMSPMQTRDGVAFAALTYVRSFENLSRLHMSASVNRSTYAGDYPYASIAQSDFQRANQWMLDAQYLRVFGSGHKLTFGGEWRVADEAAQGVSERPTGDTLRWVFQDVNSSRVVAAFGQIEWRIGDKALLTTGVRHDRYQDLGATTNPRLALVLQPAERTTIKALYGTAFRAPNVYERFYDDRRSQKAAGKLAPENVRTVELEIEQQVGELHTLLSAYHVTTRNLINLTTDTVDGLLVFANEGAPTSRGLELEVRGRVGPVSGRASYALQDAHDERDARLVDSPRNLARVGVAMPLLNDHLNVAVELRHVGARAALRGADAPAYTGTNLTLLAHPHSRKFELLFSVKDLLNSGHFDPGGEEHRQNLIAQDGRTVRLGVRFSR